MDISNFLFNIMEHFIDLLLVQIKNILSNHILMKEQIPNYITFWVIFKDISENTSILFYFCVNHLSFLVLGENISLDWWLLKLTDWKNNHHKNFWSYKQLYTTPQITINVRAQNYKCEIVVYCGNSKTNEMPPLQFSIK